MRASWWLIWVPSLACLLMSAAAYTRVCRRAGRKIYLGLLAHSLSLLPILWGVGGLFNLARLQSRAPTDFVFEGTGLLLSLLAAASGTVWLLFVKGWRNMAAWFNFAAALVSVSIWAAVVGSM